MLALERLVRREEGEREVEIGRPLVLPVIDLLPQRLWEADADFARRMQSVGS